MIPCFMCPGPREAPPRTHKNRVAPSPQKDCTSPFTGPFPSCQVTASRLLAGVTGHRRTEQEGPSAALAENWDLGGREGLLQFFVWTSLAPSGPWSAGSPLTSGARRHHTPSSSGTPEGAGPSTAHQYRPTSHALGPFQPQRVVSSKS